MSNHAVIDDRYVYFHQDGRTLRQAIPREITLAQLLALAEHMSLKSLWVMPDTALSREACEGWLVAPDGWTLSRNLSYMLQPRGQGRALLAFSAWREGGKTRVIMFPRQGDTWELAEASSPVDLLAALDYLEQALEIAPYLSAGDTGQRLMKRTNGGARHSWTAPVDLSAFPDLLAALQGGRPRPFSWHRSLTPEEARRPYLIGIDKNSAYPAACTGVSLGIGAPRHVLHPQIDLAAHVTGCYRLAEALPPPVQTCTLPPLAEIAPDGWLWTPSVAALHKLGYLLTFSEGYYWQESKTVLRPWAEHIWQARQGVRGDHARYPRAEARDLAQQAIKRVANVGLQWLDLRGKDFSTENAYHRPDWYALVRDRARAVQLEQIAYFATKYNLSPVLIHVDALYYASPSAQIDEAMPGVLARAQNLGGYKNAFTAASLPLAPFVDLFTQAEARAANIHHMLHDYMPELQEA